MVCAAVVGFAFFVGLVTERDLLTVAVVLLVAAHVRAARLEAEVAATTVELTRVRQQKRDCELQHITTVRALAAYERGQRAVNASSNSSPAHSHLG